MAKAQGSTKQLLVDIPGSLAQKQRQQRQQQQHKKKRKKVYVTCSGPAPYQWARPLFENYHLREWHESFPSNSRFSCCTIAYIFWHHHTQRPVFLQHCVWNTSISCSSVTFRGWGKLKNIRGMDIPEMISSQFFVVFENETNDCSQFPKDWFCSFGLSIFCGRNGSSVFSLSWLQDSPAQTWFTYTAEPALQKCRTKCFARQV